MKIYLKVRLIKLVKSIQSLNDLMYLPPDGSIGSGETRRRNAVSGRSGSKHVRPGADVSPWERGKEGGKRRIVFIPHVLDFFLNIYNMTLLQLKVE